MSEAKTEKLMKQLLKAAKTFVGVYLINEPLEPDDERGVHDFMPSVWPRMGDLRRLKDAAAALDAHIKAERKKARS